MDLGRSVESTALPALVCDADGKIVAWNEAAETLLGYRSEQVLGGSCDDLLQGLDVFGNRYSLKYLDSCYRSIESECLHPFELRIRNSSGESVAVEVSSLALPCRETRFLHLLRPIARGPNDDGSIAARRVIDEFAVPDEPALTQRELDVLVLLKRGRSTAAIAKELSMSAATARTHIQHLMQKLGAHSRLEAVARATQAGLI